MGNLVALICELTQSLLAKQIAYSEELQATVMEVSEAHWTELLFLRWQFSVSVAEFLCRSVSLLQCIFLSFLLSSLFGLVCSCVCVHACMIRCLAPVYSVSIILIHNLYLALCAREGNLGGGEA